MSWRRLWQEIAAFGKNIASVPLSEIRDRLTAYETRILDIVRADPNGPDEGDSQQADADDEQAPLAGDQPSAEPTDTDEQHPGPDGDNRSEGTPGTETQTGPAPATDTGSGTDPGTAETGGTDAH